ncbi:hypothetical protein ACFOJE_13705 [Azotobacter bryophylli]|uniref:Uncharacterized protein n=1 Tax=Azotobacter bryophylli TaxID=1986537 RepID=A0ABV7AVE4_9GAMM
MTIDAKSASANIHEVAIEKLRRLQQSPRYRSFYSLEAIDAFAKVESSVFAGGSLPHENCRETPDN